MLGGYKGGLGLGRLGSGRVEGSIVGPHSHTSLIYLFVGTMARKRLKTTDLPSCHHSVPLWSWNQWVNEDGWSHPHRWPLGTNENYLMVKRCHWESWLISKGCKEKNYNGISTTNNRDPIKAGGLCVKRMMEQCSLASHLQHQPQRQQVPSSPAGLSDPCFGKTGPRWIAAFCEINFSLRSQKPYG